MFEKGISVSELAKVIGISKDTFYRKLKKSSASGTFSIEQCIMMSKYMKLTSNEVNEIFFGDTFAQYAK